MYQVEMTPVVKTVIRPVPDTEHLGKLYNVFLDKGVHFRVEQINDEQLTFYWTRSNEYLYDTIAKEISELLNPAEGTTNAWVESTETEQPKAEVEEQQKDEPYVLWYEGEKIEEIKGTLEALYPDDLGFYWDKDKIVVRLKKDDCNLMEDIRSIAELIDKDAVRLISIRGIGKEDADDIMRGGVHEHKEKIRGSNYVDGTLTVLVDNDPVVIKWFEEPYSFTYTGPDAEAINDTLTAFYSTKVETKLEGEKLTIKWKWWDAALEEEISSLIDDIVNDRLRLLRVYQIGKEDADTFMRDIVLSHREKIRQSTYNDNTLTILLNYEPGLTTKLEKSLRALALDRFFEDGFQKLFKDLFSDKVCDCPNCQKGR